MRHSLGLLGLTLASSLTFAGEAAAQGVYTELDVLYFTSPGDFDGEQTLGLTLGYALDDTHSVEAEVQINGLDSNKFGFEADADLITYLLGYRNNFLRTGNFDVFAGAGIGYSKAEFYVAPDAQTEQDLIIGFARVGADYSVSERFYLSGELRYQHTPDLDRQGVSYEIGGTAVIGLSAGYQF